MVKALSKLDLYAPITCLLMIVFYLATDFIEVISLLGLLSVVVNIYNGVKEYQNNRTKIAVITFVLSFILLLLTFMNIFST
ncbi:hypothetical protein GLW05_12275 [Pontibacillus yanchengensis]|uniref:Uncharacterized protein n=1 Tax=Pontibacillus yanchengensis TaxID=462910 RepID=A0A6I4ZYT8_9BACI|nr:hypothetical protein [Pontibacillus yanchengensis]MYL34374.1 hypothetical protein [Pontibacillus yanchengensis]